MEWIHEEEVMEEYSQSSYFLHQVKVQLDMSRATGLVAYATECVAADRCSLTSAV